jgi:hypothetical protein
MRVVLLLRAEGGEKGPQGRIDNREGRGEETSITCEGEGQKRG